MTIEYFQCFRFIQTTDRAEDRKKEKRLNHLRALLLESQIARAFGLAPTAQKVSLAPMKTPTASVSTGDAILDGVLNPKPKGK